MSIHQDPRRVLPLAGILAPVCAVIAARVIFSAGPAEAPAAVGPELTLPVGDLGSTPAPPKLTEAQAAVLAYRQTLTGAGTGSPMARPSLPAEVPVKVQPRPAPSPAYDPSDDLELSAVMGKGPRAIASISGRIYRLGDEVVPGWSLAEIDVRNRTATLTSADGRGCVLRYRQDD